MDRNRRSFLGWTAAGAALPAVAAGAGLDAPALVVVNANVVTMDPRAPRAKAFAVQGGRFTAVAADVRGLAGARTQVIDAHGMTVVPGFIDCHNHADGEALLYE